MSPSFRAIAAATAAAALTLAWAANAFADSSFTAIPKAWRLEDYNNGEVHAYFTPSTCVNGHIYLPASANSDTKNRFWSTVMTAKITGKAIGIFYDPATCIITHFFLDGE